MLNEQEKLMLEEHLYHMLKEGLFEKGKANSYFSKDDDGDSNKSSRKTIEKNGIKVSVEGGEKVSDSIMHRAKTIMPSIEDTNDDSVQSFNLTRSQLAYALWPNLDKDSARSKFSQKVKGEKAWKPKELNKLVNIISSTI